ncbi:Cell envelope-associated transcriptional attenuator [Alkalibacterium sp. AK22]|uniref:LCP family protein n=1 Tax=Alkalibacterium sp. AK22 TaxID=1229520 RepID=UPI000445EEDC|nr:LCP family protein [Alkalibacterium sp. AK22]EXJ23666.1 Cell envelope-associated transcriptional attenuator [Alkalibacterium sp. AK22]
MRKDSRQNKRIKNKWSKRILLAVLLLAAFVIGTVTGYYGQQITQLLADVSEETPEELRDTSESDESIRDKRPLSFLILGLDEDDGPRRADSLMVATINPQKGTTKLVSIPRDTMITLPHNGQIEKINALYAYSQYGLSGTIDFLEDYLDIPISFYATLNFEGLVDLVDSVGGITVDSPLAFTVQDSEENMGAIEIEEGIQTLDGEQALGYARMRKQDPRGDFGRQERQREVIESLLDEMLSFSSITRLTPILNAIRPNLQTNMTASQIMAVATSYTDAAETVESVEIAGTEEFHFVPAYNQELYFFVPDEDSLNELQKELRAHLELDEFSVQDDSAADFIPPFESGDENEQEILDELDSFD